MKRYLSVFLILISLTLANSQKGDSTLNKQLSQGPQGTITSSDENAPKRLSNVVNPEKFYEDVKKNYAKMSAANSAVLVFPQTSAKDITLSAGFMKKLKQIHPELHFKSALDVGAGVGRVSKEYLVKNFEHVDLVEQDAHLLQKAIANLKNTNARAFYFSSLQEFKIPSHYDVIWIQAVFNAMLDDEIVGFLSKAKQELTQNGVIVVKDFLDQNKWRKSGWLVYRSEGQWKRLFGKAGLEVVYEEEQLPSHLIMKMFALQ